MEMSNRIHMILVLSLALFTVAPTGCDSGPAPSAKGVLVVRRVPEGDQQTMSDLLMRQANPKAIHERSLVILDDPNGAVRKTNWFKSFASHPKPVAAASGFLQERISVTVCPGNQLQITLVGVEACDAAIIVSAFGDSFIQMLANIHDHGLERTQRDWEEQEELVSRDIRRIESATSSINSDQLKQRSSELIQLHLEKEWLSASKNEKLNLLNAGVLDLNRPTAGALRSEIAAINASLDELELRVNATANKYFGGIRTPIEVLKQEAEGWRAKAEAIKLERQQLAADPSTGPGTWVQRP